MRKPTPAAIKKAADAIRNGCPVEYNAKKPQLVDEQIRRQNEAIRAQLEAWGMSWSTTNDYGQRVEGRSVWFTVITEGSAKLGGRWSDNAVECELHMRMYTESADVPAGQLEVVEDPECTLYNALKSKQIESERQVRAIERKKAKTEARYTDTTTSDELLAATVAEGMLF